MAEQISTLEELALVLVLFILVCSAEELLDSILLFYNLPSILRRTLAITIFIYTTTAAITFLKTGFNVVPREWNHGSLWGLTCCLRFSPIF